MRKESLSFLQALIEAPSPSGYEQPAQRVVRDRMAALADEVKTDVHGNVMAVTNPGGSPRVMLAGHCDQIGLMVKHITDEGYIYTSAIGGMDANVALAQRMKIHGPRGPVLGVIGRTAIHLLGADERRKGIGKIEDIWLDIGVSKKSEAEKLANIGDPITFAGSFEMLQGDLAVAPGFDDKMGTFIVMEAMRILRGRDIPCALHAVSTVQEEIGLRGAQTSAFGIDPQVGIAVDVTHATDYPGANKNVGGDLKLGEGPVIDRGANINHAVFELLVKTAKKHKIKHQVCGVPRGTGTDANVMQVTRAGVATGLISVANRYMHTPVEVINLRDLENSAKLVAETVAQIDDKMDFRPL